MVKLGMFLSAFLDTCAIRTGLTVRALVGRSFASYDSDYDLELEVGADAVCDAFANVQELLSERFSASLGVMWRDEDINGADLACCILDVLDLWKMRRPLHGVEPSEVVRAFLEGLLEGDQDDKKGSEGNDEEIAAQAKLIWREIAAKVLLDSSMNAAFRRAVDAHPDEPDFDGALAALLTSEVIQADGDLNLEILSRAICLAEDKLRAKALESGVVNTTQRGSA